MTLLSSSLEEARENYADWKMALNKFKDGAQSYKIGSRELVRADLDEIISMVNRYATEIEIWEKTRSSRGTRQVVFRDI